MLYVLHNGAHPLELLKSRLGVVTPSLRFKISLRNESCEPNEEPMGSPYI